MWCFCNFLLFSFFLLILQAQLRMALCSKSLSRLILPIQAYPLQFLPFSIIYHFCSKNTMWLVSSIQVMAVLQCLLMAFQFLEHPPYEGLWSSWIQKSHELTLQKLWMFLLFVVSPTWCHWAAGFMCASSSMFKSSWASAKFLVQYCGQVKLCLGYKQLYSVDEYCEKSWTFWKMGQFHPMPLTCFIIQWNI